MRFAGTTSYFAMFRGGSRPLLGVQESKPKRGRLSVSKGTREARPSMLGNLHVRFGVGAGERSPAYTTRKAA